MGGVFESVPEPASERCFSEEDPFEFEERFLLTRAQVTRFFASLARHAAVEIYDRERPIAYTRTTYLDTDDFAFYRSCQDPVSRRLRFREYAMAASLEDTPILSPLAFLELKQFAGTSRSKVRLSAPPNVLRRLIERRGQCDDPIAFEQQLALGAIQQELCRPTMAPRLTTWYRRAALTAESGRVRITLDERLTFCRPQTLGVVGAEVAPAPGDVFAAGPARILEIKRWGARPGWLTRALIGLEQAPEFSKFRMGMSALGASLAGRGAAGSTSVVNGAADAQALLLPFIHPQRPV
jgi:hypothetical protein